MTINYIVKGFDKDFYNFDAVVVPVAEKTEKESKQEVYGFRLYIFDDFRLDLIKILQKLPISAFKSNRVTTVKSEETGIYYIFVLVHYLNEPYTTMRREPSEINLDKNYIFCCEEMIKYINTLDVKNILVHPVFNQVNFNFHSHLNMDIDFLAKTLESSIDRFSRKNIYILVEELRLQDRELSFSFADMRNGIITPEECVQIYVENQTHKSLSYTNSLIRIAEIETKYTEKSIMEQFYDALKYTECFFYEYINRYQGTATELAKRAGIDNSTISKIKKHEYKDKSRTVVISLAIALDLTANERERFINSAGFSYPITPHDRFIEQRLRSKRYNNVTDFNKDIMDEYPDFVIKTRALKGYKNRKEDK